MEETSEYCSGETPDILIPAVDVQMVVDDNPLVFNDDPEPMSLDKYKEEMLKSGLTTSDFEYFSRAYKNLKEVKYIKIHCTSCDKHLGSAADQKANRYEHPLLKVVICERCYMFYSSGDFEKDEDGSELYCRWCGEGGEVYCCTKCPYVFCKKCIRRNLGRGTARSIQNSDNWMCFACSPSQINRHRATYWALQKYSDELIEMAKMPNSVVDISMDGNICCISGKKRAESHGKLKTPNMKKSNLSGANNNCVSIESPEKMPSTSNANNSFTWQTETNEDQDEVICTPDIIPIDDSPPGSPKPEPAPVVPLPVQSNLQVITQARVATLPPLRPTVQTSIQMAEIQKQLQKAFQQKIFLTQASQMCPKLLNTNPVIIKPGIANSATGNFLTLNDNKYKFVISNSLTKPAQSVNTNYILTPVTAGNSIPNTAIVQQPVHTPNNQVQIPNKISDWFDQAVVHCTEVTTYITTKISSLAGVHTRAYKSEKLMEELHNTLQTYMHVAIEKMHKVKKTMKDNFENERAKDVKLVNPYAKRRRDLGSDESSFHGTSMSEVSDADSNYLERPKKRRRRKFSKCAIEMVKPEDVPFDMTVTNASDEELSMNGESRPNSPNDVELVGEIKTKGVSNEIISLLETTDDEVDDGEGGNEEEENKKKSKEVQGRLENNDESLEKSSDVSCVEKSSELSNNEINNDKSPKKSVGKLNNIKPEEIIVEVVGKRINKSNESQDGDVEKLVDNVHQMENEKEVKASKTSDKSNEEDLDIEEALENNRKNLINKVEEKADNEIENEVEFDVEDMLNSAVVPKSNNNASKSFGDVFSKFINRDESHEDESGKTSLNEDDKAIIDENEKIASEVSSEKISHSISQLFPDIGSDMEDHDNSCLSLPPDGLMEYCMDDTRKNHKNTNKHCNDTTDNVVKCTDESKNIKELDEGVRNTIVQDNGQDQIIKNNQSDKIVKNTGESSSSSVKRSKKIKGKKKNVKKRNKDQSVLEENSKSKINKSDKGNSEVILESEIMALKQMAENCMGSSVDMRKTSAECKG